MLASMRLRSWLFVVGLGVVPQLAASGCVGDEEHLGDGQAGASAGAGVGAAAGAPPLALGGNAGEAPLGAGGSGGGSSGGQSSGGSTPEGSGGDVPPPPPPELPKVVTAVDQPCSITLTKAGLSPTIGTVGMLEFESSWIAQDAAPPESATIEFGKSGSYGLVAPVELDEAGGRALLLGMTPTSIFHYRIVLTLGQQTCTSTDLTLVTGPMPNGVGIGNAQVTLGTSETPSAAGYFLAANYNGSWIFILDQTGALVWYYESTVANISSVRLAPDARHVYARTLNVGRIPSNGKLMKIAIDGSSAEVVNLTASHHDFNFGPEGSIVYIRKSPDNECDSIYLHWLDQADDSQDEMIADLDPFFTTDGPNMMLGGETCHANSVHYHADGSYTVSDLVHNAYVKVDELGAVQWILGGGVDSTFDGDGSLWARQHGHHLLGPDRLLFFNNQTSVEKTSRALEVILDFDAGSATYAPFQYSVDGLASQVLGDVRRLPGGNTLVTYSVGAGLLHEVDPAGELVRAIDLPGGACGYTDFRESLYAE